MTEPNKRPSIAYRLPYSWMPLQETKLPPAPLHKILESNRKRLSYKEAKFAGVIVNCVEHAQFVKKHTNRECCIKLKIT